MKRLAATVTLFMTFGSVLWALAADISSLKEAKKNTATQYQQIAADIREIRSNQSEILKLLINRD